VFVKLGAFLKKLVFDKIAEKSQYPKIIHVDNASITRIEENKEIQDWVIEHNVLFSHADGDHPTPPQLYYSFLLDWNNFESLVFLLHFHKGTHFF
jgi:hypothetical protein